MAGEVEVEVNAYVGLGIRVGGRGEGRTERERELVYSLQQMDVRQIAFKLKREIATYPKVRKTLIFARRSR